MINNILFLIGELSVPIIMLIVGIYLWKCPPKMSENFGYLTRRAKLSEDTWNAAQTLYGKYSTIAFAVTLAATLLTRITAIIINTGEDASFVIFIIITAVQIAVLIAVIAAVEHKLKTLFDENGKPKQ